MQEKPWEFYENQEVSSSVKRYEAMKKTGGFVYFDVEQFEDIVNFYIDKNQLNKAQDACTTALSIHPSSSELKLKNAQLLVGRGNATEALNWLNQVTEMQLGNHEYHLTKGMALVISGFAAKAQPYFEKALELGNLDDKNEILLNIGEALENSGDFQLAIAYYQRGIHHFKNNEEYFYRLGYCYDRTAEFEKSIEYYEKYLDINPFSDNVWFNLGIIYNKTGNFSKAIEAYEFTLALDDAHFDALYNKANALANAERHHEAIEDYKLYLTVNETSLTARYYIGECFIQLKEFDKAMEYFDGIITDNNAFAEAYYGKALVYEELEELELARQMYIKTLSMDNENTDAWFSLGGLYDRLGEFEKAMDAFFKTTHHNKFDIEAWLANAEVHAKMGHIEGAVSLLTEAIDYMPDFPDLIYSLSGYLFLAGHTVAGIAWFKNAYLLDPENFQLVFDISPDAKDIPEIKHLVQHKNNISD